MRRFSRRYHGHWKGTVSDALGRFMPPVADVLELMEARRQIYAPFAKVLVREMHARGRSFWGWTAEEWLETICPTTTEFGIRHGTDNARAYLIAAAYLWGGIGSLEHIHALGPAERRSFARKVFGREVVDEALGVVLSTAKGWGYGHIASGSQLGNATCEAMLVNRSPRLEDLTADFIDELLRRTSSRHRRAELLLLSRVLHGLGVTARSHRRDLALRVLEERYNATDGVAPEWVGWCRRWREASTVAEKTRQDYYLLLIKAGHWLARQHPEITSPEQWTREIASEYVAAVCRMTVGEYGVVTVRYERDVGRPLTPKSKMHHLDAIRAFFRDGLAHEWFAPRFDPRCHLATPRSIRSLVGPNPRVIADDIWAKLLWAGLNLEPEDLSKCAGLNKHYYPLPMVKALTIVWLFSGLRANEIRRLRVGCVRWQASDGGLLDTSSDIPRDAVCLIDVPVGKEKTAFTKPVDRVVGEAIGLWEQARPEQPLEWDPKTAERIDFLFAYRARQLGANYLNESLIPALCKKAGLPEEDARGPITSHRARSTIASQLFNAKDPMTLFELQEWLGHHSPASTQHYAKITPTKLNKAYERAGYFSRNVRTIEVLVDHEAVRNGAAAKGKPYLYYDLGHGFCTYDFFAQCPHRMACAKCDFYAPKDSLKALLLEANANLARYRQEVELSEEELAAVEEGLERNGKLLQKLVDVPTPAGPTPRELQSI